MRRRLPALLLALALSASACATVDQAIDDLRGQASDATETVRFCLAVTRALTSLEGSTSPEQASEAAEEVLARVPDDLRDDARTVAETLRRAADGDQAALDEPAFREAGERLRDRTRDRCDPTS